MASDLGFTSKLEKGRINHDVPRSLVQQIFLEQADPTTTWRNYSSKLLSLCEHFSSNFLAIYN